MTEQRIEYAKCSACGELLERQFNRPTDIWVSVLSGQVCPAAPDEPNSARIHRPEPLVLASLLPLANGSTVLRADVMIRPDGVGEGIVLALTPDDQYVTWQVIRQRDEPAWVANAGEYFDRPRQSQDENLRLAIADYEDRRKSWASWAK